MPKTIKPRTLLLSVIAAASGFAPLSGCYERTVRTSGFGADTTTTYEPNLKTGSNSKADSTTKGKFRWDK